MIDVAQQVLPLDRDPGDGEGDAGLHVSGHQDRGDNAGEQRQVGEAAQRAPGCPASGP